MGCIWLNIYLLFLMVYSHLSISAQWLVLQPADIKNIQLIQADNSNNSAEGLYIALHADIGGAAASYCPRKDVIVITDPKLIDRVYSGVMFAMASQKVTQFYIDGSGGCVGNVPLITMFMVII